MSGVSGVSIASDSASEGYEKRRHQSGFSITSVSTSESVDLKMRNVSSSCSVSDAIPEIEAEESGSTAVAEIHNGRSQYLHSLSANEENYNNSNLNKNFNSQNEESCFINAENIEKSSICSNKSINANKHPEQSNTQSDVVGNKITDKHFLPHSSSTHSSHLGVDTDEILPSNNPLNNGNLVETDIEEKAHSNICDNLTDTTNIAEEDSESYSTINSTNNAHTFY